MTKSDIIRFRKACLLKKKKQGHTAKETRNPLGKTPLRCTFLNLLSTGFDSVQRTVATAAPGFTMAEGQLVDLQRRLLAKDVVVQLVSDFVDQLALNEGRALQLDVDFFGHVRDRLHDNILPGNNIQKKLEVDYFDVRKSCVIFGRCRNGNCKDMCNCKLLFPTCREKQTHWKAMKIQKRTVVL